MASSTHDFSPIVIPPAAIIRVHRALNLPAQHLSFCISFSPSLHSLPPAPCKEANMAQHSAFCAPAALSAPSRRPAQSPRVSPSAGIPVQHARGSVSRRAILEAAALALGVGLLPSEIHADRAARLRWAHDVLYDEKSGSFIPPSSISSLFERDLRSKFDRCIIASEIHDHPRTHAAQMEILERARLLPDGRPLVVGFEQFYRAHNPFLEQYVAGAISLKSLLNVVQWNQTWGFDPQLYTTIFQWCRFHRIPMVGLNVPRKLVNFVSMYGLEGLSPELRSFLPADVDTTNEKYFRMFQEMLGIAEHSIDSRSSQDMRETLWKWYEAQVVWDEYMSESVAQTLRKLPESRLVALIGAGHVQGRVGFPDRIEKRLEERPYTIVPRVVSWSSLDGHAMPDILKPEKHVADIVWYTNRTIDLA